MTLIICLWKSANGDTVQGYLCHITGIGEPRIHLSFESVQKALSVLIAADVPEDDVDSDVKHRLLNHQEWKYEGQFDRENFEVLIRDQAPTGAAVAIRRDFEGSRLLGKRMPPVDDEWE
jgi:hypothetical protein